MCKVGLCIHFPDGARRILSNFCNIYFPYQGMHCMRKLKDGWIFLFYFLCLSNLCNVRVVSASTRGGEEDGYLIEDDLFKQTA